MQIKVERAELFKGGDELATAADTLVQLGSAVADRNVETLLNLVELSVLPVRIANWRFLTMRDLDGPETFKANAEQAAAAIAALEAAEMPDIIRGLVTPVRAALATYMASFDVLSANILRVDDLCWNSMMPQIIAIQARL